MVCAACPYSLIIESRSLRDSAPNRASSAPLSGWRFTARVSRRDDDSEPRAIRRPVDARAVRDSHSRANPTTPADHASLDAILEEKDGWEWSVASRASREYPSLGSI